MSKNAVIRRYLQENNPDAINFDGLEDAIVGVGNQYTKDPVLIYSAKKIVRCLMKQGMTYMEALDYYGHNTECLWAGEGTPIIIADLDCEDEEEHKPTDTYRKKRKDHALAPRQSLRRNGGKERSEVLRVQGRVRSADSSGSASDR